MGTVSTCRPFLTLFLYSLRKRLVLKMMEEQGDNFRMGNVSLIDACRIIKKAWADVTSKTIKNSFEHSGLSENGFEKEDVIPLTEWMKIFNIPREMESFVQFEEDVVTSETLNDDEIIEMVKNKNNNNDAENDGDDDDDDGEEEPKRTSKEALKDVKNFLKYAEAIGDEEMIKKAEELEKLMEIKTFENLKQNQITDYFK